MKQLQRYNLNVFPTSNGEEAIAGIVMTVSLPHLFV